MSACRIPPKSLLLVLTATINPAGVAVTRADPSERERDYMESMRYWAQQTSGCDRILFLENSGWDLQRVKAAVAPRQAMEIEFISIGSNAAIGGRGRGYGEWRMLVEGLAQSNLAKECSHIVKLTGRLKVLNLDRVLAAIPRNVDLVIDNLDGGIVGHLKECLGRPRYQRWLDTRLFVSSLPYWSAVLQHVTELIDESKGLPLERCLFEVLPHQSAGWQTLYRLPVEPLFSGVCAGNGQVYDGIRFRGRFLVENAVRCFETSLKIPCRLR